MSDPTIESFVDRLRESGLLSNKRLERVAGAIDDDTSVKQLANQLVEKRWLTKWQTRQILLGRDSFRIGKYLLLNRIESHRRASIFKAQDTESKQYVRLDVFVGGDGRKHSAPRRVLAQFRKAQSFEHRGTTRLFELFDDGTTQAIVSEWVSQSQLATNRAFSSTGNLPPPVPDSANSRSGEISDSLSQVAVGDAKASESVETATAEDSSADRSSTEASSVDPAESSSASDMQLQGQQSAESTESDPVPAESQYAGLRGDRKRVACLIRDLAVIWSHAHDKYLYDPLVNPSQILLDSDTRPKLQLYGIPIVRAKHRKWDKLDPIEISDDGDSDGAAVAAQHDVTRLGRLAFEFLQGDPRFDASQKPESRLEAIFRAMIESDGDDAIHTMSDVVKTINRWQRANGESGGDSNGADRIMSELDEAARAMAQITSASKSGQASSPPFELGPAGASDPDQAETDAPVYRGRAKIPPHIAFTVAGVLAVVVLIATSVTVAMLLRNDNEPLADNSAEQDDRRSANRDRDSDDSQQEPSDDDQARGPETSDDDDHDLVNQADDVAVGETPPNVDDDAEDNADGNSNPAPGTDEGGNQGGGAQANNQNADADGAPDPGMPADQGTANQVAGPDNPEGGDNPDGAADDVASDDNTSTEDTNTEPPVEQPRLAFDGVAAQIELPELGEPDAPAENYSAEFLIGEVHLREADILFVDLLGGDKAFRGKDQFVLRPVDERPTAYRGDILLVEDVDDIDSGITIASFFVRESKLYFQWNDVAPSHAASAYLCNCMFVMRTGNDELPLAMRGPIKIDPLSFEATTAKGKNEVDLDMLPRQDVVRIKLLPNMDSFPDFQYRDNANSISAARGSIFLDFAEQNGALIQTRVDSTLRNRLVINLSTFVVDGRRPIPFNARLIQEDRAFTRQTLDEAQAALNQFLALPQNQKQMRPGFEQEARAAIAGLRQRIAILDTINNLVSVIVDQKIPYRVYIEVGDFEIDLATPDGNPTDPDAEGF